MLLLFFIIKIKNLRQFSGKKTYLKLKSWLNFNAYYCFSLIRLKVFVNFQKKISINGLQIMFSDVQIIVRIEILPKFHHLLVRRLGG